MDYANRPRHSSNLQQIAHAQASSSVCASAVHLPQFRCTQDILRVIDQPFDHEVNERTYTGRQ
jgi:hypothetical protein